MQFDMEQAEVKLGHMYKLKTPDPDCLTCRGQGVFKKRISVGGGVHPVNSYCDCIIEGIDLKPAKTPRK